MENAVHIVIYDSRVVNNTPHWASQPVCFVSLRIPFLLCTEQNWSDFPLGPNVATQLDRWDLKTEMLHSHFAKLQSKAFSTGLSTV